MSIVTKNGDGGFTDFPGYGNSGGKRVRKDDPGIEYLGALDELDAFLALAGIELRSAGNVRFAELVEQARETILSAAMSAKTLNTEWLEEQIAKLEKENPFRGFVRSWTKPSSAALNIARAMCRRAERRMVSAAAHSPGGGETPRAESETPRNGATQWINRLSDLLFLLAASEEKNSGI